MLIGPESANSRAANWVRASSGIGAGPSSSSNTSTVSHRLMHQSAVNSPVDATYDVRPIRPMPIPV
jgi:hypothetical protein